MSGAKVVSPATISYQSLGACMGKALDWNASEARLLLMVFLAEVIEEFCTNKNSH